MAGTQVLAEIAEQPTVLARIAASRPRLHAAVAAALPQRLRGICMIARGSSDNVAVHARYLLELATGIPVSMIAPSIITRYHRALDVQDMLIVALSQSGRTPEIVDVAAQLRRAGGAVIAITNDESSPLAEAAAVTLSIGTSPELAVPATKTVTGELALVTALAEAVGGGIAGYTGGDAAWDALASTVGEVLSDRAGLHDAVAVLAPRFSAVHLGRGLSYAAALEGALKAKETARRVHEGYSSADFMHGPLTVAGPEIAVVAYCAAGPVRKDVVETAAAAVRLGSPVIGIGDPTIADRIDGVVSLNVPPTLGEALTVIPLVVRGQQLAIHTALALGMDPDSPEGLNKVTATR